MSWQLPHEYASKLEAACCLSLRILACPPGSLTSGARFDTKPICCQPCRLGSSIKLQTQLPPQYSDEELQELQQGECAACKQLLPPPGAKPSGWLRGSHKVRCVSQGDQGAWASLCQAG